MTHAQIHADVMAAEKALDVVQEAVSDYFGAAREAIIRMDHAYEQVAEERDHLRAERDRYKANWAKSAAARLREMAPAVPRVITADELEVGQVVAIYDQDTRRVDAGLVLRVHEAGEAVGLGGNARTVFALLPRRESRTLVLLADAPTASYAAEDHEDAEVTQWHEGTRRVADILRDEARKVASVTQVPRHEVVTPERRGEVIDPADLRVGDVYDAWVGDNRFINGESCTPYDAGNGDKPWQDEPGYEFRLIHRPEVTAADIRASEPGSCFEDEYVHVWEWDGHGLRLHRRYEDSIGYRQVLDSVLKMWAPLTRSNATPRGDYTKRELPTEPGSVIQVTEVDGEAIEGSAAILDEYGSWLLGRRRAWCDVIFANERDRITGWNPVTLTVEGS